MYFVSYPGPPPEDTQDKIRAQTVDYIPPAIGTWAHKYISNQTGGDVRKNKTLLDETRVNWEKYRNSMLPETRKLLDDLYEPFNKLLADLLGDDRFLFKRTS